MRHVALALALFSVGSGVAEAQERPMAVPQTVRVTLRSQEVVQGYLRGKSTDEVVIYTSDARFRRVPRLDVQRFEVRSRTGSHLKRGAFIGVLVWGSIMGAAALGALDDAGVASWQSGAILAGSTGLGAVIGSRVPRYGWRATEPSAVGRITPTPGVRITVRF